MEHHQCHLDGNESAECWISDVLDGIPLDEKSLPIDRINKCITCDAFAEAIERSTGRRRSDRVMTQAINRFLALFSNYNRELNDMADSLKEKIEELTVLKTVAEALLKATDLKKGLKIFLSGITSGEAFGFNRAVVFLVNHPRHRLEGVLGLGHLNVSSYGKTWDRLQREKLSFDQIVEKILNETDEPDNALSTAVAKIHIPLRINLGILPKSVILRKSFRIEEFKDEHSADKQVLGLFDRNPCAVVPIISKEVVLGVVVVDNPVTRRCISDEELSTLETLSYMTAARIDNLILQNQLELRVAQLEHVNALLQDNKNYLVETEPLIEAGRMATTIAHEIKTPLVTIAGYAMRAKKEHADGKDISHNLDVMLEEISRLEKLAGGILDFSRERKLTLETLDLNTLINETLDIVTDKLSYSNIEVIKNLCDKNLYIKVDRNRMKQVLFNLIDNAMQAMPDGGKLEVSTGTGSTYRWFKIKDTGCGMSKETVEQLFKPFYTTKSAGCGLGLPVSRRIVNDHGGYLEVESIPGEQSVFTVNLPAADEV